MTTATPTMPRKKPKRNDENTKFDKDLLNMARTVIVHMPDVPLAQYLSDSARQTIEADYRRIIDQEHQRLAKKKSKSHE